MFFDHASTTKIFPSSLQQYVEVSENCYYNPSALYKKGLEAKNYVEKSRSIIKRCLNASMLDQLIFTSGATEADQLAILGSIRKNGGKLLFAEGEHPAIDQEAKDLGQKGYKIEFIKLTKEGVVDIVDFKKKCTPDVVFISIMHISNETGAINPIASLVQIAKQVNPSIIFHSDGVQAFGKVKVNVQQLGVDLYTISGHKIHGPKGIGALYVKQGITIKPVLLGGGQENGKRSGTENVPAIVAFADAATNITKDIEQHYQHVLSLKQYFLDSMKGYAPFRNHSFGSPYIISCSFIGMKAETLLHSLEQYDIYIGTGSACSSKKTNNRTLQAMGLSQEEMISSVRISFSFEQTIEEVQYLVEKIKYEVDRYLSILYKK